jgi:hypothetical protein
MTLQSVGVCVSKFITGVTFYMIDSSGSQGITPQCGIYLALPSESQHGVNIHKLPVVIAPARS